MSRDRATARGKNGLEWAVFAVSLVVVLATFAVLIHNAVTWPGGGPVLRVVLGPPVADGAGWRVPLRCGNEGGGSAEHVVVEVALRDGERVETAEVEIERIARGGVGRAWVSFARAGGELTGRVKAYQEP